MSTRYIYARAQYASATRFLRPDDPDLLKMRRRMQEEALLVAIRKAVNKVPDITPELRQRAIDELAVANRNDS